MRRLFTLASLCFLSATAFAQGGDTSINNAKPADPAKKPEMGPPGPSEEMKAMAKEMSGVWKCQGKVTMGGMEMKAQGKMTMAPEMGGHFLSARMESPKSKEMPGGFKVHAMVSYDAATKTFTRVGYDSMGAVETSQSKGMQGDKLEWSGKTRMAGMDLDTKETITRTGPKESTVSGTMGAGTPMAGTWELTCKK